MKKVLAIFLTFVIVLSLIGCSNTTTVTVNVENSAALSNNQFGMSAMVHIGDGLWYDSTTRIVYWWNGSMSRGAYGATTPSPYYAPNGLPYRYNPETCTFEEFKIGVGNGNVRFY